MKKLNTAITMKSEKTADSNSILNQVKALTGIDSSSTIKLLAGNNELLNCKLLNDCIIVAINNDINLNVIIQSTDTVDSILSVKDNWTDYGIKAVLATAIDFTGAKPNGLGFYTENGKLFILMTNGSTYVKTELEHTVL